MPKRVPKIRFKKYTDEWKEYILSEFLEVSKEKNSLEEYDKTDVLSVSGECGIVNQIEHKGRSFAGASVANYGVVDTDDVVYTKSPLLNTPYGIIKTNKGKPGIVSTLYAVYKPKENVDPNFIECYFEQNARINNYLKPLVNKGAKNDMKVTDENALNGLVVFPDKNEQLNISNYINNIDKIIRKISDKYNKLQNIKTELLKKMFSVNENKIPEIRFYEFKNDWNRCKLMDNVQFYNGLTYTPNHIVNSGGTWVIRSSNVQNNEIVHADDIFVDSSIINTENVKIGDVVVVVRNGSRALIGKHAQIKEDLPETVIGAFMVGIRYSCPEFLNALLSTNSFNDEVKKGLGATINQITMGMFKNMELNFTNPKEERKIGIFFKLLDDLITLHQYKLDMIKNIKKAYLAKMFV